MSESDLESLPEDVAALLAVEARRGSRPAARRDAVFAKLSRTLALGGGFGGDGNSGDGGDPGSSDQAPQHQGNSPSTAEAPANPAPPTGPPVPAEAAAGAASAAGAGLGTTGAALLAGATFVLGGIVGAGLSSRAPAAPMLTAQAPAIVVSVSVVAPSAAADPAPAPSADASSAPQRVGVAPITSASAGGRSALAEERTLLEGARRALKSGDVAAANRDLDAHTVRFPAGQLREEREALRVQALVRAGSLSEARQRAAAFRQRFPDSAFNPAIDASLGAER